MHIYIFFIIRIIITIIFNLFYIIFSLIIIIVKLLLVCITNQYTLGLIYVPLFQRSGKN